MFSLGHTVVAAAIDLEEVGDATRRELPDVGLGESSDHALELISKIVHSAACPVIAILHNGNHDFVNEAAKRGIFAFVTDGDAQALQSALDIRPAPASANTTTSKAPSPAAPPSNAPKAAN